MERVQILNKYDLVIYFRKEKKIAHKKLSDEKRLKCDSLCCPLSN